MQRKEGSEGRRSKGQMSLNYVVTMIILLVVAGVVIGIATGYLKLPWDNPPLRPVRKKCNTICRRYETGGSEQAINDYCTESFEVDVRQDGDEDDVIVKGVNLIWESDVRCFNVVDCELENGNRIGPGECVDQLCDDGMDNNTVYSILKPENAYPISLSDAESFSDSYVPENSKDIFITSNNGGLWNDNWYVDLKQNSQIKNGCN